MCRSGSVQSVSTAGVSELTLASSNTNTDPLLPHDENTEMETTSVGDSTRAKFEVLQRWRRPILGPSPGCI